MNWELLWQSLLLITLFSYSALVVIVFVGGIKNIKDMLKDLQEQNKTSDL